MIKVSAAVIKYEDKILLMRRSKGQTYAGYWEFPGGKVKEGERTKAALERELAEELFIKAKVGKLITSVPFNQYEIFAYDVQYFDGLIRLTVHDNMEWVTLDEALKYNLLPADKKIVMHMTKTKEKKKPETPINFDIIIAKKVSKPVFNPELNKWDVTVHAAKAVKRFDTERQAFDFYIQEARKVLGFTQTNSQQNQK